MIAPETVLRHELCGLRVAVVDATNPDLVGIEGRVVDETTNTLRVEVGGAERGAGGTPGAREKTVPKAGATFEFALPDGERVLVEGARLVARPARRTETAGGSTWR